MVLDSIRLQNFHYLTVALEKMSLFLGADTSSSVRTDTKNKDILILNEGLTQELDDTPLTAESYISY